MTTISPYRRENVIITLVKKRILRGGVSGLRRALANIDKVSILSIRRVITEHGWVFVAIEAQARIRQFFFNLFIATLLIMSLDTAQPKLYDTALSANTNCWLFSSLMDRCRAESFQPFLSLYVQGFRFINLPTSYHQFPPRKKKIAYRRIKAANYPIWTILGSVSAWECFFPSSP